MQPSSKKIACYEDFPDNRSLKALSVCFLDQRDERLRQAVDPGQDHDQESEPLPFSEENLVASSQAEEDPHEMVEEGPLPTEPHPQPEATVQPEVVIVFFCLKNFVNFLRCLKQKPFRKFNLSSDFNDFQRAKLLSLFSESPTVSPHGAALLFSTKNLQEIANFYQSLLNNKSFRKKFAKEFQTLKSEKEIINEALTFSNFRKLVETAQPAMHRFIGQLLQKFVDGVLNKNDWWTAFEKKLGQLAVTNWFINSKELPLQDMMDFAADSLGAQREELVPFGPDFVMGNETNGLGVFRLWCCLLHFANGV